MALGDNIRYLRESHGLTQMELARIAGVSDKAVSTWESNLRMPRMGPLERMANYFGVTKGSLLEDLYGSTPYAVHAAPQGDLVEDHPSCEPDKAEQNDLNMHLPDKGPETKTVPAVQEVSAVDVYDNPPTFAGADFGLVYRGDSMAPTLLHGDTAYIRRQAFVPSGALAAVRRGERTEIVRIFYTEDRLILQPDNRLYPPQVYNGTHPKEVTVLGRVVGIYRKL